MLKMTDRQRAVLDMIGGYASLNGYPPTVREITAAFGWASTRAAMDHLVALERKGAITRRRGAARTIRVVVP